MGGRVVHVKIAILLGRHSHLRLGLSLALEIVGEGLSREIVGKLTRGKRLAASVLHGESGVGYSAAYTGASLSFSNVKLHRGTRGIGLQRRAHGVIDRLKDRLLVGELDLQLCRVDVDVHACGVERKIEHAGGEFFGRKIGGVRLLQSRHGGLALDVASVDEEILVVAVGLDVVGASDKSAHADPLALAVHLDHTRGKLFAEHRIDGVFEVAVASRFQLDVAVHDQAHGDVRIGERHLLHVGGDRHGLGNVLLEEFPPRGNVGKEVLHDHRRARGAALLAKRHDLAAVRLKQRAELGLLGLGDDAQIRDRRDRGKCLAAEAQRQNAVQILGTPYLAGGVAANGGGNVLRLHAAAVVGDAHKGNAAVLDLHGDARGSRVDGVLHQLLDDRCRSVHHLARGDQIRNGKG